MESIGSILGHRVDIDPFNIVATGLFLCAIIHTFLTNRFLELAHKLAHKHSKKIEKGQAPKNSASIGSECLHFLGEVEAVFSIWELLWLSLSLPFTIGTRRCSMSARKSITPNQCSLW
jgi:hypothetical protein